MNFDGYFFKFDDDGVSHSFPIEVSVQFSENLFLEIHRDDSVECASLELTPSTITFLEWLLVCAKHNNTNQLKATIARGEDAAKSN